MEYDIKRLDAGKLTANITIEPDELAEEEAKVVKRLTKEAEIDGYRKGKAPEELIRKRYQESIRRDVSGKLMPGRMWPGRRISNPWRTPPTA